eukprot:2850462-Prymnesium_polylepis.2
MGGQVARLFAEGGHACARRAAPAVSASRAPNATRPAAAAARARPCVARRRPTPGRRRRWSRSCGGCGVSVGAAPCVWARRARVRREKRIGRAGGTRAGATGGQGKCGRTTPSGRAGGRAKSQP